MAEEKTRSKGSIVDANDLRYFLRVFSKNWYFLVVAIVLAAILSYLYSYKIPEVYGASTQILLKDQDVYNYQSQVYQNIGFFAAYGDIVNQKRVLTSYDLIDDALGRLDFDVSYYIIGRFKTSEVYVALPFTVEMDLVNTRLYERPFDLRIIDVDRFELSYDNGNGLVAKIYEFDTDIQGSDFLLRVDKTEQINENSIDVLAATDYQFVRHSRRWLVSKYKQRMLIENLEYTSILQITVEDEIATRAKMFLDTMSRVYINYTLQSQFEINENTISYIDKQLDGVTEILNEFEDELQQYKETKEILDLNREENRYFGEMVKFDNERRRLELMISSVDDLEEYLYKSIDEKLLPPAIYVLDDDGFLKQTLNALYTMQMERSRLLFDAKESNQVVQKLDSTIMLNRRNLLVYINNTRDAIKNKVNDVSAQVKDYENLIRKVPQSQRDILNIERKVQVNEKLYLFLLEKRANTIIAKAGIIPQTKVIESARSLGVVRPDKLKIMYSFIVGGIVLALLLIFVRVLFYERIENADQLKELTKLPVFGEVISSEKAEQNYIVVDSDPKAAITESFRTIRTNLEYLPETPAGKVVVVTSYRPNEGKTFCSVNLAAILAKAGKKVLLLEMDLHKPKVGVGLNMSSKIGLSNVLVGKNEIEEAIIPTHIENFDVMLSGPTPPNASELVLSKYMAEINALGRQRYDYVIIDTPPVGLITDALIMMKQADASLFVLNTRFASKDHLKNALEVFEHNHVQNFGFILNGVRMKRSKYYYNTNYGYGYRYAYGYGSGYGYGYGYGGGKQKKDTNNEQS